MNSTALLYALGTVLCWGVYSVLLHLGSMEMGKGMPGAPDPMGNRMKAFLLVGVAYFLVAVVAPLVILKSRPGTSWTFPLGGWSWSLIAGIAGAVGAFFLLMALSSGRSPAESKMLPLIVPAIVFAGAPTKEGNWAYVNWRFVAGIVLAVVGTAMVMRFKPAPPAPAAAPGKTAAAAAGSSVAPGYADVTTRRYHVS